MVRGWDINDFHRISIDIYHEGNVDSNLFKCDFDGKFVISFKKQAFETL